MTGWSIGIETAMFARTIWPWEIYLVSHLGLAFLIAGTLGTPGCEMRALLVPLESPVLMEADIPDAA